jgi:hypothetical protein
MMLTNCFRKKVTMMLTNCVSTKATMNQLRQDIGDDDVDQLGQDEDQDQLWQDDPLSSSQQTCCEWWEWLRGCENGYGVVRMATGL